MKALVARTLLLFALTLCSLATHGASLQTPENTTLLVPAATIAAGGIPGSTNLAGSNFMMSAVATATSRAGTATLVNTQQWVSRFTNNDPSLQGALTAMALRPDGDIVVTGYSYAATNGYNFLTLCYTADGTLLWTNLYDGPNQGNDMASFVCVGTNGAVWVAGQSMRYATNSNLTDAALVCYASNGVPLWTNRYTSNPTNGDSPAALLVDVSGNAYLSVLSTYWPPSDVGTTVASAIIKFDPLGNPVWTNAYLANAPDSGQGPYTVGAMALDATGDFFGAGRTGSENQVTGNALVKFAGNGTPLWTNYQASVLVGGLVRSLIIDPQGDVIATEDGYTTNETGEYVVTKYSGDTGNPLWTNTLAGPDYESGGLPRTVLTPAGDVLLIGGAVGTSLPGIFQVLKLDRNGVPLWTNLNAGFGANASDLYAAAVDDAGGLYLVGNVPDPTNGSADFTTIKYSSSGQPVWTNFYNGPAGQDNYASALAVNGSGDVFVGGESTILDGAFEFIIVEYADELSYTPPRNFIGLDTINYTLTDVFGNNAAGSVQVSVTATNFQVVPLGMESNPAGFELEVAGVPGTNPVIIEASSDLLHWQPVFTNAPTQGVVQFLDTSAPGLALRFYRASQQQ